MLRNALSMKRMDAQDWRPSPDDVDIYRALVGRRMQVGPPLRFTWAEPLRRWAHSPRAQAMVACVLRRAREGAARLAR